jgi:hypothetical protein
VPPSHLIHGERSGGEGWWGEGGKGGGGREGRVVWGREGRVVCLCQFSHLFHRSPLPVQDRMRNLPAKPVRWIKIIVQTLCAPNVVRWCGGGVVV